jgi:hypothetical protein
MGWVGVRSSLVYQAASGFFSASEQEFTQHSQSVYTVITTSLSRSVEYKYLSTYLQCGIKYDRKCALIVSLEYFADLNLRICDLRTQAFMQTINNTYKRGLGGWSCFKACSMTGGWVDA